MSADTIFRVASMVKLLTSVAALQLVERGKLKLDEPAGISIRRWGRPRFSRVLMRMGFRSCARRKTHNAANLLEHTSGFSYLLWDPNVVRYLKVARSNPALPRMPLMFEPGSRWAYGGNLDSGRPGGGKSPPAEPGSLFQRITSLDR